MLIDQLSPQSNLFAGRDIQIIDMCNYLRENCTEAYAIVLFGSYARRDNKLTSDLDILLLTKEEIGRYRRSDLVSYADLHDTDLIIYTLDKFRESECLLANRIRKEGLVLWKA